RPTVRIPAAAVARTIWMAPALPSVLAATGTAFVRVDQVGYALGAPKRAYLMSSAAEAGATFTVKNAGGSTVYSAPIGANLGSWSSAYPFVYALDLDPVATAGTYTIAVAGPVAAVSPSFRIDTPAAVYAAPLTNGLTFLQNERDGPAFIPSALRAAAGHLHDQAAMTYLTPPMNNNGHFSGDL